MKTIFQAIVLALAIHQSLFFIITCISIILEVITYKPPKFTFKESLVGIALISVLWGLFYFLINL